MSELSGLELRRAACEVLGFKLWIRDGKHGYRMRNGCVIHNGGGIYIETNRSADPWPQATNGSIRRIKIVEECPAIERDPEVSEPMFLEWCENLNWYHIDLIKEKDREWFLTLSYELKPKSGTRRITVTGKNLSEVRARAIVEANERHQAKSR